MYYDLLNKGSYVKHYVIDGLYHDLAIPDDLLINVNVGNTLFIYGIGLGGIYLKINTTNKVLIGEIAANDKNIVITEYDIYLYNYDGELLERLDQLNVSIIFDPIIYKDTIMYRFLVRMNHLFNL